MGPSLGSSLFVAGSSLTQFAPKQDVLPTGMIPLPSGHQPQFSATFAHPPLGQGLLVEPPSAGKQSISERSPMKGAGANLVDTARSPPALGMAIPGWWAGQLLRKKKQISPKENCFYFPSMAPLNVVWRREGQGRQRKRRSCLDASN